MIVTGETAGGITISGVLSGRIKHATNPLLGTDDTSPSFNLAFAGATVSNGIFDVEIASRFTAPIQAGSFSVTATEQPFGSGVLTGNGFLTSDQEFVLYELTDQSDGHKIFGWAGVPTTTFPTTGATFYNFRRDFVMDSDVPFVSKASGGSIISNLSTAEADAAIFWDTSGSSSALRPFGARFGGLSGEGPSQQSVISVLIGDVTTLGFDTAINGFMRGSSRVSTSIQSHIFAGEFETSDDAFLTAGDSNDFYGGTSPDYFVLEGRNLSAISDKLGTAAVLLQPNNAVLATTDTLRRARRKPRRTRCTAIPGAACSRSAPAAGCCYWRSCSPTTPTIRSTSRSRPAQRRTRCAPPSASI